MKPYQPLRRVKASERIYSWLVRLYPAPFRAVFGNSMKQVFRDQCLDAVQRKGTKGLVALWLRVLPDFVWTCPKEHIIALPTLPRRMWEQLADRPIWLYPLLVTLICFLIAVSFAFQLPQFYSSTAIVMVRVIVEAPLGSRSGIELVDLSQVSFEKPDSKATLYPVIEKLDLRTVYQKKLGLPAPPSIEETHKLLCNRLTLNQSPGSAVIRVAVHDEDKRLAKTITDALVEQYRRNLAGSEPSGQSAPAGQRMPNVVILKAPEESNQRVRPHFRGAVLSGGKFSFAGGGVVLFVVLVQRRRIRQITRLSQN